MAGCDKVEDRVCDRACDRYLLHLYLGSLFSLRLSGCQGQSLRPVLGDLVQTLDVVHLPVALERGEKRGGKKRGV